MRLILLHLAALLSLPLVASIHVVYYLSGFELAVIHALGMVFLCAYFAAVGVYIQQ